MLVREAISEGVLWPGRPRESPARACEGEYALVSSRLTNTAHPACLSPALAAPGCTQSGARFPTPPPRGAPAQKRGSGTPRCRTRSPHARSRPPPPQTPRRLGRIVKEAATTVVEKAASARPRGPLGRPRPGDRGGEPPHFSPRDGRGPRELTAETQGQAYSPGGCGLLRLNSRVGGGQTTQPWVSPDTAPPPRLVGASPELQRVPTRGAGAGLRARFRLETHPERGLAL